MFRNLTCSNCNLPGHIYNTCPGPFVSYGVILFRKNKEKSCLEYLMLRRKNSFGFIDFVKGKYSWSNINHIQNSIDQMSVLEKAFILQHRGSFTKIWNFLDTGYSYRDYTCAAKKFEQLKTGGVCIRNKVSKLENLFESSKTHWAETEWEFPKGRKLVEESEKDCAIREFVEETGFPASSLNLIDNLEPFVETFIGSNLKPYKHCYLVAFTTQTNCLTNFQESEVSKLSWKSFEECMTDIRPYHLEKKEVLRKVNLILTTTLELVE